MICQPVNEVCIAFVYLYMLITHLLQNEARGIVVSSDGVMPPAVLELIARVAREQDIWVLSDEIYARLVFDGRTAPSIAALPSMAKRTIIT